MVKKECKPAMRSRQRLIKVNAKGEIDGEKDKRRKGGEVIKAERKVFPR